jgi:hypothetical protein
MRFLPAAIAAFFMLTAVALGQTVDTGAPPVVVDTVVAVPVGSWLDTALGYLTLALGGIIAWAFRALPTRIASILMTLQAEQLMTRALTYAINAVAGATRDKVWTIDVRNQVLKEFVTYVLVHGSAAAKDFIGTPADIAEKGLSRIDVPTVDTAAKPAVLPEAPKPDFVVIGAQAQAAATVKGIAP